MVKLTDYHKHPKAEKRFIQFPLYLLRSFFSDKKGTINNIFSFGIYRFSKRIKYDNRQVANQVIYDFYRNKLSATLRKLICARQWKWLGQDEYHKGFDHKGKFSPHSIDIEEIIAAFNVDAELKVAAITHYQIHTALNWLRIIGDIETIKSCGKKIEATIPEKEPLPMANVKVLMDVYNNDKSEFELAQFASFIAVKSILGKKSFIRTNKAHIIARMFGFTSIKVIEESFRQNPLFKKYSNRYHIDRLLTHLELKWNVKTYSNHMRGMYISVGNSLSIQTLATKAEESKMKNRLHHLRNTKQEAKKIALKKLGVL